MDDQITLERKCIDPADAVGIFIVGDGELLPKECELQLRRLEDASEISGMEENGFLSFAEQSVKEVNDLLDSLDLYELSIEFTVPNKEAGPTVKSDYLNMILEWFSLPPYERILQQTVMTPEMNPYEILPPFSRYRFRTLMWESGFNNIYYRIITSKYMRTEGEREVYYVLKEPMPEHYNMFLKYFYEVCPYGDENTVPPPRIRPVANADLEIIGLITYHPKLEIELSGGEE